MQKNTPRGSYQGNYCLEGTDTHTFSKCSRSQSLSQCRHMLFTVLPCTMKHLLLAICCMPSLLLYSVPLKSTPTWTLLVHYRYFCFKDHSFVSMLFLDSEDSQSLKFVFNILPLLPSFSGKKTLKINAQF